MSHQIFSKTHLRGHWLGRMSRKTVINVEPRRLLRKCSGERANRKTNHHTFPTTRQRGVAGNFFLIILHSLVFWIRTRIAECLRSTTIPYYYEVSYLVNGSHILPGLLVAFAVFTAHGHRYRWTMAHVHLNSPANVLSSIIDPGRYGTL